MKIYPCMILLLLLIIATTAYSQTGQSPPVYNWGPSLNYCDAVSQPTTTTFTTYGNFSSRWLINSDCAVGWTVFLGDTITVGMWGRKATYWIDWNAIPNASAKIQTWTYNPWGEPLTVSYDPYTMVVTKITSPSFPE